MQLVKSVGVIKERVLAMFPVCNVNSYTLVTRYFCVFANYVCYLKSNGNKYASILGNPDIQDWGVKLLIFSYPSVRTFVLRRQ